MYHFLAQLADTEDLWLEPSALAGMYGPILLEKDPVFSSYPSAAGLSPEAMQCATHIVWATGGSMVPSDEMHRYYETGKQL